MYVSIDLEGLPGISSLTQVAPGLALYNDARRVMTWAANIVSTELKSHGINEITIADSHGLMSNIPYLDANEYVNLIQGYPRPFSMIIGIEKGYDALFFLGYHAAAGTREGFLDHTYSSRVIHKVTVDGEPASEFLLNAYYAGYYGVPVVFVAGDEPLRSDVEKYTPWAVFIPLKKGLARIAALHYNRRQLEDAMRRGVRKALEVLRRGEAKPLKPKPLNIKVELREAIYADMAQLIPGARRLDAYTLEYHAGNPVEALAFIELVAWIGLGGYYLVQSMYR